ncbi:MAG: hypothetical protein GY903_01095 [Fuerstiella sp.]|nr:hypothetical protein [Fuerstiella sp.]MCP4853074.1 hypothetical protein [Fuerstiella sp.]
MTSEVPDLRRLQDVGSSSKEGLRIIGARFRSFPPALAAEPTTAKPGTVEKLAVLHHRYAAGLPLFDGADKDPGDPSGYVYSVPGDFMTEEDRI